MGYYGRPSDGFLGIPEKYYELSCRLLKVGELQMSKGLNQTKHSQGNRMGCHSLAELARKRVGRGRVQILLKVIVRVWVFTHKALNKQHLKSLQLQGLLVL